MTFEEFIDRFQIKLNEQQLAAVKSVERATLLLAVPGSGKTTVLVTRLGYMIYCCGIAPEHILTVTYTVAATRDMQNRFAALFGQDLASRLEFRTINGICARIISYYGNCLGKKAYDLVTDEGHKSKLLSAIYVNLCREYPTESDLKNLSTQITYIKNRMLGRKEIENLGEELDLPLFEIYTAYCQEMRGQSQMDYDDQMVYALTMLKKAPQVLTHFQEQYQYICVDEAQDTSKIQHEIIRVLAGKYEHLFMVGDEDQSIYGFRAAYPEALLDFEKMHPDSQVLLMEENFRSNAKIVAAADRFIQKNEFRHKKTMKAAREAGVDIQNIEMKNRKAQYTYLVKVAENCQRETAVLYRDNECILPVVDLLERKGISYRIKNADLTFFSHRVVADIENIIRFAADPADTDLFLQIYYKIGLFMNKEAAMNACRDSVTNNLPILEAALRFGKITASVQKNIRTMQTHLREVLLERADRAVNRIVYSMGYGAYLERTKIKDTKVQILKAIASNESSALSLVDRLQELAALIRGKKYDFNCKFLLSTIHSSKGLEYDRVYLMDAKDGIFPETVITNRKRATQEELKAYEEERRLFYVGVTRAKNDLCLFSFKGESTFVGELLGLKSEGSRPVDSGLVQRSTSGFEHVGARMGSTRYIDSGTAPSRVSRKILKQSSSLQQTTTKRIVTESEYYDKMEEIRTTGYVSHKMLGEGTVRSIKGDTIEVEFTNKTAKCKLKYMMEQGLVE